MSEEGGLSKDGPTYERVYQVFFSGGYSCAELNRTAHASLPKIGDEHPEDDEAKVQSVKPSLHSEDGGVDEGVALYSVSYGPKPRNELDAPTPHPLDRPAEISGGGSDITETADKDVSGEAIKNSAGDFYDPLPERYVPAAEITISRNEETNPLTRATVYSHTVNSGTWYGVAAGNALLGKISWDKQSEEYQGQTITYWKVTYPISLKVDEDGWRLKLIDNGYRKLVSGEPRTATDDVGNTSAVPVLLDGSGGELSVGGTPVVYPTDGYQIYVEQNWNALALPNPFAEA